MLTAVRGSVDCQHECMVPPYTRGSVYFSVTGGGKAKPLCTVIHAEASLSVYHVGRGESLMPAPHIRGSIPLYRITGLCPTGAQVLRRLVAVRQWLTLFHFSAQPVPYLSLKIHP